MVTTIVSNVNQPRWEVDLTFKVTGRGRIGADGLAFWYTAAKVNITKPLVFG